MSRGVLGLVLALAAVGVSGCGGASATNPTCGEFLAMEPEEQEAAVVEWWRRHDPGPTPEAPHAGRDELALVRERQAFTVYCRMPGNEERRLSDIQPVPAGTG